MWLSSTFHSEGTWHYALLLSKRFYFICLFIKRDVFQTPELIQSEWAPCSWLASTFVQSTRPTRYLAGICLLIAWTNFSLTNKTPTLFYRLIIFSPSYFWRAERANHLSELRCQTRTAQSLGEFHYLSGLSSHISLFLKREDVTIYKHCFCYLNL